MADWKISVRGGGKKEEGRNKWLWELREETSVVSKSHESCVPIVNILGVTDYLLIFNHLNIPNNEINIPFFTFKQNVRSLKLMSD
jgi:hypothetical protein